MQDIPLYIHTNIHNILKLSLNTNQSDERLLLMNFTICIKHFYLKVIILDLELLIFVLVIQFCTIAITIIYFMFNTFFCIYNNTTSIFYYIRQGVFIQMKNIHFIIMFYLLLSLNHIIYTDGGAQAK